MVRTTPILFALALAAHPAQAGDLYITLGGGYATDITVDDTDASGRSFEADYEGGLVATAGLGWRKRTARGAGLRFELNGRYFVDDFALEELTLNGVGAQSVDRTQDVSIQQFDTSLEANDPLVFDGEVSGYDVALMGYYDWTIARVFRPYFGAGFGYGVYEVDATAIFLDGDQDTVTGNCILAGVVTDCLAGVGFSQEVDTFVAKATIGLEYMLGRRTAVFGEARYEAVVNGDTDATVFVGGSPSQADVNLKMAGPAAYAGVRFFF